MRAAAGLFALWIVGVGELWMGRGAIAQSLPTQAPSTQFHSVQSRSESTPSESTSESASESATAADLVGTQSRRLTAADSIQNKPTTEATPTEPSVSTETIKLELRLSERRLMVYRGEMLIAHYSVAVGREGWQTPTGEFSVTQKQIEPTWEHPFTGELVPPGPGNPLGSRWIGFWSDGRNLIGFHGTPDESVIGSAVSHGCVRMRDEDIRALYEIVSVDTRVVVLP